jgi:hypothetical protein
MPARHPTRFCCDDELDFLGYDGLCAEKDLERWQHGDLYPATRELIQIIRAEGVDGAALLDIGAGVGAVHLSKLDT